MAGQACELMEMEAAELEASPDTGGVSLEDDFCIPLVGLLMVKTLVFEPKAPSIDMVNQEGC